MIKSLFIQHYPALVYFASKMLHNNRQDGEDIVMAVFYKLCKHWEKYKTYPDKKSLLYIWTKQSCLSVLKAKQLIRTPPDPVDIERKIIEADVLNTIQKNLHRIPEMQRKAFEMTYIKHMDTEEICNELHITATTVRGNRFLAIRKLREIIV